MNLSQNLWNQAENYKQELELALSSAIEKGISAVTLSKRVSKYLNDFDSLKKDYKQKYGKAVDIHDCEYRSIRLARSEINMAYRTAEQTRWQQMDFILGYEIKLSHSHPCHDICDELKGRYPKDFKWVGWHPNDMCYVVPIIKSEEQWWEDEDKRGTDNDEITDVPQQFKNWVANNQDRIARAEQRGTLPYFVRDNKPYVQVKSITNIVLGEHFNRDEDSIRRAWSNRKILRDEYFNVTSIRKHAKITGVNIDEFEKFISTANLNVDSDGYLKDADKVDKIFEKYESKIKEKYDSFNKAKENIKSLIEEHSAYPNFVKRELNTLKKVGNGKNVADSLNDLEEFKEGLKSRFKEFSTIPLKIEKEGFFNESLLYRSDSPKDKFSFIKTSIENLYGDIAQRLNPFAEIINIGENGQFVDAIKKFFAEYEEQNLKHVILSVNKLHELKTASLDVIHKPWIARYNDYVLAITDRDFAKYGYYGVFKEMEGAYNILKLSSDPRLVKYGLDKISVNTPYTLIEHLTANKYNIFENLAKKEFYDGFNKFVPLFEETSGRVSAYYHQFGFVKINFGESFKFSKVYRQKIQYHEFGHAMDFEKGQWHKSKEWEDLFDKYVKQFNKEKDKIHKKYWDEWYKSDGDVDIKTQAVALSDVLQSLDHDLYFDGHGGHSKEYFKIKTSRIIEFIAHASENYWQGNSFFEKIIPSLYKEMKVLYKKYK